MFVDSFRAGPGLELVILYSWLSGMQKHTIFNSEDQTQKLLENFSIKLSFCHSDGVSDLYYG
jgi:hypothetical protein